MTTFDQIEQRASIVDPHEVQKRLNREVEHGDATQMIFHLCVYIFLLAIAIAIAARYSQCLSADDDDSPSSGADTTRRQAYSLCDSLIVPTLLDAVFGGNRRRTRLRRFSIDP